MTQGAIGGFRRAAERVTSEDYRDQATGVSTRWLNGTGAHSAHRTLAPRGVAVLIAVHVWPNLLFAAESRRGASLWNEALYNRVTPVAGARRPGGIVVAGAWNAAALAGWVAYIRAGFSSGAHVEKQGAY